MFKIESLSNRVAKAGKLLTVVSFIIVDEKGEFVSGTKEYATEAEAQSAIDGMAGYAEGLAFAKSAFPSQADKAQIGKANVVAEYLAWVAGGRVDKPVDAPKTEDAAPAEPEATLSEVEDF